MGASIFDAATPGSTTTMSGSAAMAARAESFRYLAGLERLVPVVQEISLVRTLDALMDTVRRAARELTGADGATFVLRDGDFCYYAEEDAIEPLWKGRRFPVERCISGWTMLNRRPAVIEDIYSDPRIPAEAYRPTFVKSLVMVPIRTIAPVGAIGNYWAKRRQPTDDEVKLLSALADSTSIAMENIALYTTLEQRVQERTAALAQSQEELADKNRSLLLAQRQKEELAALLVHDLKSPASGILMTCRARLRSASLAEIDRRYWKMAEASADVIQRLALNLLDVSRSEDGALAPKIRPLQLDELLAEVADLMLPLAEGRQQRIELVTALASPVLHADREILQRVLQNLLDNAIRHSAAGSCIRLEGRSDALSTEIRVIDAGEGVPETMRDRIFEKYARVESDGPGRSIGFGLGLAFCRLAVRGHGGEIRIEANEPRGSVFVVRLPTAGAPAATA